MIINIKKVKTRIAILHNVPKFFFKNLEDATHFDNNLFPKWAINVFTNTDLLLKFEAVYKAYKSIADKNQRDRIIKAFVDGNEIQKLCDDITNEMITLNDLSNSIQQPLKDLFTYLYNTAINYHGFQHYAGTSVALSIDQFIRTHKIEVCPICGLEGFLNLTGQSRLALDHWLCQDIFPLSSINFNNLIPLGDKCNSRPAKGNINVLLDRRTNERSVAYYPYFENKGIKTRFEFLSEPTIEDIKDEDWTFTIEPNDKGESNLFQSWSGIFNIQKRYDDFVKKNVLSMWESDYKEFIDDNPFLSHATNLETFKQNLIQWKSSFKKNKYPGFKAYRSFVNYLIYEASEGYLTGLYKNLPLY